MNHWSTTRRIYNASFFCKQHSHLCSHLLILYFCNVHNCLVLCCVIRRTQYRSFVPGW